MRITRVNTPHLEVQKKPSDSSRGAFSFLKARSSTMPGKWINAIFILTAVVFWMCPIAMAQNNEVRARYNAAIDNIVTDIIQAKSGYPELESFSQSVIQEDSNGFKSINYAHDSSGSGSDPYAYKFSIRIQALESGSVSGSNSSWEERFPLLGFKVIIEAQKQGEWASFDASRIVETSLEDLKVVEQEFLPFRLELKTDKEVYSVREEILLTATLKNASIQPYKLADLDEDSLYCKIGDKEWGNGGAALELNKVLSAYGTVKKILKVSGMETPQELWIGCSYALGYKGVQPYSRVKISIQPKR